MLAAQRQAYDACVAAKGAASCSLTFEPSALVTGELLLAFALMGVVALIPVLLRRFRKISTGGEAEQNWLILRHDERYG